MYVKRLLKETYKKKPSTRPIKMPTLFCASAAPRHWQRPPHMLEIAHEYQKIPTKEI